MLRWASENLLQLKPEEIGEHYGRYRLHVPEAERAMAKSLERYGQLSPVVVCRRGERYELIDGFKRLPRRAVWRSSMFFGAADGSRRADRESLHLWPQLRRRPARGNWKRVDHPRPARGRHEPGGSGGAFGAA